MRGRALIVTALAGIGLLVVAPGADGRTTTRKAAPKRTTAKRSTTTTARPVATTTAPSATAPVVTGRVSILAGAASVAKQDVGSVDLTRLPLGTSRYASAPTRGAVMACRTATPRNDGVVLPWITGSTFDLTTKVAVAGKVAWTGSTFTNQAQGAVRVLSGNDLPPHTTGVFPVATTDPAYRYRPNPSAIAANNFSVSVPANPAVAATASCVGGEIGVTLNGIELFNAFDAEGRDAVAEEVLDHCEGHPNAFGYHYHSLSNCIADPGAGHSKLIGYAFDGFGIFGHRGESGKVLTNADLDECHGHTHAISWDGRTVAMYHYHATWEFPYMVGCFRGTSNVRPPAFGSGPGPGGPGPGGGPPPRP